VSCEARFLCRRAQNHVLGSDVAAEARIIRASAQAMRSDSTRHSGSLEAAPGAPAGSRALTEVLEHQAHTSTPRARTEWRICHRFAPQQYVDKQCLQVALVRGSTALVTHKCWSCPASAGSWASQLIMSHQRTPLPYAYGGSAFSARKQCLTLCTRTSCEQGHTTSTAIAH
jgi:hypothetical protein